MLAALPFPNVDPVLISFEVFGRTIAIHWYAIAYIVGFILAWRWIVWLMGRPSLWPDNKPPMKANEVEDLLTWMVIGTIIGGRLGYMMFYYDGSILGNPSVIFKVWEGGMSFHGGFAGVIVAGVLFCLKNGLNTWSVGDAIASSACFGLFFGRLSNFINGELWGRPTDVAWGVIFPGEAAQNCGLIFNSVCARHPSQLYEAGLEGIVLFAIFLYLIFRANLFQKPGRAIAVFFLGYGLARTFVEGFRQGDEQFTSLSNPYGHIFRLGDTPDSLGITMGQVLSLPMIAIGLFLWIYSARK